MGEGESFRVTLWKVGICWIMITFLVSSLVVSEETNLKYNQTHYSLNRRNLLDQQKPSNGHQHIWPPMKFGWKIIVGSIFGFIGAAFGSVGGIGGGGIYVPMLTLIIRFDPKSAVPISKCMVMGAAVSTVYYNLKKRHPVLDIPLIDYNLTLLIQPMLMLGISLGVTLSEILADWMITVLLIFLFLSLSTMSFFKGIEAWKKETLLIKEVANCVEPNGEMGCKDIEKSQPHGESRNHNIENKSQLNGSLQNESPIRNKTVVSIVENVYWKELLLLILVWVAFLILQIFKNKRPTCSPSYWILAVMQIPISVGMTMYMGVGLYKGKKVIASMGEKGTNWKIHHLIFCSFISVVAGAIGGLLGMGGGIILGPLFLQIGIPPQVSSATATFAMTFSSSMSVVEFYLLKRFPVPYAAYFLAVTTFAAIVGQFVVNKLIKMLGRASLIIFVLSVTIFVSAVVLGGEGISHMIPKFQHHQNLGFLSLCQPRG